MAAPPLAGPPRPERHAELHPLLDERYSPRAFLSTPIAAAELTALLEAARWSPSWGNAQLSRFVVVERGGEPHARLVATLNRGNVRWAPAAPVLLLAVAARQLDDGQAARHAAYDLGQSVAHLTFQAATLGLAVHQMAGFDCEAAERALGVPPDHEAYSVVAVGRAGDPSALPEDLRERELRPRHRVALGEVAFRDRWGEPFRFDAPAG